jgi:hypothetical protein
MVDDDDYGIGGTGIVGSVTGFGSIFVNGIEIEIDERTPITVNGRQVTQHDIAIGETVEVLATDSQAYTHAARLNIRHEIIGPVSSWDATSGSMSILGQLIRIENSSDDWQRGQYLAVSGYVDAEGVVQARRIDPAGDSSILLRGDRSEISARLAQAGIDFDRQAVANHADEIRLSGRLTQNRLAIDEISQSSLLPFARVRHWRIEGFVHRYQSHWSELEAPEQDSPRHPIVFEVELDDRGQASIKALERGSLPRGAQIRRGFDSGGFAAPRNRTRVKGSGGNNRH